MKLRNIRPGEWEIPDLRIVVEDGEQFDVDDPTVARNLLEQDGNYAPADDEARSLRDDIEADREVADEAHAALPSGVSGMKAGDIMPLLPALSRDELEETRTLEAAGKSRTTVLARIDELLAVEPGDAGNQEG